MVAAEVTSPEVTSPTAPGPRASETARWIIAALTVLSCLAWMATTAWADAPPDRDRHHRAKHEYEKGRVILPSAAPAISAAFNAAKPTVTRFDASVQRSTVRGKACTDKTCYGFVLSDPERGCNGAKSKAFCLTWQVVPPQTFAVAVASHLESVDADVVWRDPPGRPAPPLQLLLVALAVALLPLIFGFLAGRGLRSMAPNHPGIRSLVALILAVVASAICVRWSLLDQPHPAAGDAIVVGAALFAGLWLGGLKVTEPKVAWLAVVGSIIGLVGAEAALRQSVPKPPECWHGGEIKLLQPASSDRLCRGAFSGPHDPFFEHALRRTRGGPEQVVHIGDSMVFGSGVREHETFVAELDRRDTKRAHVNVSGPDTGPDHYLLTLGRWLKAHKPGHVVLYVYPGNDLLDLDRPSPCCGGTALLRYENDRATARCEKRVWQPDPVAALLRGAPPFTVQVAAQWSHLGAMACAAIRPTAAQVGAAAGVVGQNPDGGPNSDAHLTAIFATAKDLTAGGKLSIVLLPERDGLEDGYVPSSGAAKRARRVKAAAENAGVALYDATPLLAAMLNKKGAEAVFARTHARDFHFSAITHRALASWLTEVVLKTPTAQTEESGR